VIRDSNDGLSRHRVRAKGGRRHASQFDRHASQFDPIAILAVFRLGRDVMLLAENQIRKPLPINWPISTALIL
jgi:hypothetical protein